MSNTKRKQMKRKLVKERQRLKRRRAAVEQRLVASVEAALEPDIHTRRARREGITRDEAKRRNFGDTYGSSGSMTGRMSSTRHNLSNVPKDVNGDIFVGVDFGYQERAVMSVMHKNSDGTVVLDDILHGGLPAGKLSQVGGTGNDKDR